MLGLSTPTVAVAAAWATAIYTNPMMLGYAWQKGWVPLSRASLMRAIELNGVQVDNNKAAFEWGRRCAHDLARRSTALCKPAQVIEFSRSARRSTSMVAKRVEFLTGYQNAAYADSTRPSSTRCAPAEAPLARAPALTEAVARYLFKLMAYKDEYEVARLHTEPAFTTKIAGMFEGDYKLVLPPGAAACIAKRNAKGELRQAAVRPVDAARRSACWPSSRACAARALDIFGRTEERRTERALIGEYRASIEELLRDAERRATCALAAEIARIPEEIRGYGHVKERHLGRGAGEVGTADGALARQGTDQRCGSSRPGAGLKGD